MDINAVFLVLVVLGVVELLKTLLPTGFSSKLTVVLVVLVGIAAVFLVGGTVWAHEQVLGGHALDTLGVWDKIVIGLILGGGAAGLKTFGFWISNIGQNQEPKLPQ
jgi:hypothetical protein